MPCSRASTCRRSDHWELRTFREATTPHPVSGMTEDKFGNVSRVFPRRLSSLISGRGARRPRRAKQHIMPETTAPALKRPGPDEPDDESDVKRPAASKPTTSPSNGFAAAASGFGAAAGGFGAVAGGACTWGAGGGASFGGFAGAAAAGGGGFGGGFAGAALNGGFSAAAAASAAPTEKKEPVVKTFGQPESTTETPASAETAPSEGGAPAPAITNYTHNKRGDS